MGLLVRMDAEWEAAVTDYAEELHAVMVYHCSVSVWMKEHDISTTGCSIPVSPIMGQSMATRMWEHKNKEQVCINVVHPRFWDPRWAVCVLWKYDVIEGVYPQQLK